MLFLTRQFALTHEILLHPEHFGPHMQEIVKNRVYEEVEGTCQGRFDHATLTLTIQPWVHYLRA